jgi:hypothetical protein
MYCKQFIKSVFALGGVGIAGLALSGGCGDDSKTTGSQLKMSPAVKAEIDDLKSTQKELRAERKAAAKTKTKKRK